MSSSVEFFEYWVESVLRWHDPPAWLVGDAPHYDVVLSSRARVMRNLRGFPFPAGCSPQELRAVQAKVRAAVEGWNSGGGLGVLEERERVSEGERALLIGSRLVSPDFAWDGDGRSLFLSRDRMVSVMVNEEDHLRIQAVLGGLCLETVERAVLAVERALSGVLEYLWDREWGYLASCETNRGTGLRVGVMVHLGGLGFSGEVEEVLSSIVEKGLEVRGYLGETTSGIGAYVQISGTGRCARELLAVVGHLINRERSARRRMSSEALSSAVENARMAVADEGGISLSQAVRVLGWLRLASCRGLVGYHPRDLDAVLALVGFGEPDERVWNVRRGHLIRRFLASGLEWVRR
jgi:protein arginine kinase